MKCIVHYPYFLPTDGGVWTPATVALMVSYYAEIDSIVDGVNILAGDKSAAHLPALNIASYMLADHVHLTALGCQRLGAAQALRFYQVLCPSAALVSWFEG